MSDLNVQNLLVELGTEELPPKALKSLSESFANALASEIDKMGFEFSEKITYGAPRRLAVVLRDCERKQADKIVEKKGPAVSVAFDADGNPTKAAIGWAKGNGIDISQAERLKTDKGEWLLHKAHISGQSLDSLLQKALESTIKQLPIPKAMRWGSSNTEFIRPVHTLCVLYGSEVLDVTLLGLQSSNLISGHRFHGQHRVKLDHSDNYESLMLEQHVIVDYQARVAAIEQQLIEKAKNLNLTPDYDTELLEEISSLVEWPVVLAAQFEKSFLSVPKEALIYTMKDDQKYVPLLTSDSNLSSNFLFVSNIQSKDPLKVIQGNEKVIRPRLADANFFFETDKKTTLEQKSEKLHTILFQKELGTIAEKSKRVTNIAELVGHLIKTQSQDLTDAKRAAKLAKADLVSDMVMEFPSIQGVMGYHYALHDKENEAVAIAIKEQYLPRFAGDKLPTTIAGMVLSLSEKLDTLVGIFGINKIPKGDKDPFALRRSAIGILRILIAFNLNVSLQNLIDDVVELFGSKLKNKHTSRQVMNFLVDRLKPFYADPSNLNVSDPISSDIVTAVLASSSVVSISDIHQRVLAVSKFAQSANAESLVNANKRVANILSKNNIKLEDIVDIEPSLISEQAETTLYEAVTKAQGSVAQMASCNDYDGVLNTLSELKRPLDEFFDDVMIMVDDVKVQQNRIALIASVRKQFLSVADISVLNY